MKLFTKIFSGKPNSKQVPQTSAAVSRRIKNILGIRELECMPANAARAFELANDMNASAANFVEVIESDEVLCARIVRIANSVYYSRGVEAVDIDKAVANIGLDELRGILSASMLRAIVKTKNPVRSTVWANSVATALCARRLSQYTDRVQPGEAFLCGIVHDVGKLVMLSQSPSLYSQVIRTVSGSKTGFIEAEEQAFELNHVEVGSWVAEQWNFPKKARLAIAFHHDPWPTERLDRHRNTKADMLVKAADIIAHSLGLGLDSRLPGVQEQAKNSLPEAFKQIGLSSEQGRKFLEQFRHTFEREFSSYDLDSV